MTQRLVRSFAAWLAGASLLTCAVGVAGAQTTAQNVVVLIGNGLGPTTITAARLMRYRDQGELAMDTMPQVARLRTRSLDAGSSDSAAAVSALLTGVRVRNDVVAMDGATRSLDYAPGRDAIRGVPNAENRCPTTGNGAASKSLLELAIAKNKATGIVTTGRLTSGPAAAAYAHICHSDAEYEVARQAVPGGAGFDTALGRGVDVMMGGVSTMWRPFDAAKRPRGRPDGRELVGELQTAGYAFVSDLTTLNAAPTDAGARLIGLFDFAGDGMSSELDRDPKREPSLAEMTTKALAVLSTNRNGFVLVVEAGGIDRALHATNARRALMETIAFDEAVKVVLAKVDIARTLVIVTGDHDGTMALIGGGRRSGDILGLHLNLQNGKPDVDTSGATYTSLVFGTGPNRPDVHKTLDTPTVVQKDYQQESVIRRATGTDGGSDVVLHAAGFGAQAFQGALDNTRVFTLIQRAAGL